MIQATFGEDGRITPRIPMRALPGGKAPWQDACWHSDPGLGNQARWREGALGKWTAATEEVFSVAAIIILGYGRMQ